MFAMKELKPQMNLRQNNPTLARKCTKNCPLEEDKPLLQRRANLSAPAVNEAPPIVHDVLRSPGQPLDDSTRAFMEPRFNQDFGHVRVHTDAKAAESARSVNALAYTVGRDIVMRREEYAPTTDAGKRLLAHELAHVVQQGGSQRLQKLQVGAAGDVYEQEADRVAERVVGGGGLWGEGRVRVAGHLIQQHNQNHVQRKIQVYPGVSIDNYLMNKGVFYGKSNGIYSSSGTSQLSLDAQIVSDMLSSLRIFSVDGSDNLTAEKNLGNHVKARQGIVNFAAKKKYTFAAGNAMKMNTAYWEKVNGRWNTKPGVDKMKAMEDVNINPQEYKIACLAATHITMLAGSGGSPLVNDTGVAQDDWVPGDWGYVENTKFINTPQNVGLEGENIIYTGYQQFWGHFTGSQTYRTLDEWIAQVKSWHGGAKLQDHRTRPNRGLV